jgi:UDP-glucose 4-epimerase
MAILVTGGAGYIGSVTVEHLLSRGENVVVLDNLSRGHREALAPNAIFYEGNVGDGNLLARITQENEIESCIHFAAFAYVGESVEQPRKYFENNVEQGITLFGSLLRAGIHRVVFSSSCATYGEPEQLPICETARQWPTNPYGWSKLLLERVLSSYDAAYGLKFVALRYFNAAGATETRGEHHDPESHLIPNVLQAAAGKINEVSVFGNAYPTPDGTAIRDYIHVSDLAEAHACALDYLRLGNASEFLNLASGRGYSVLEVIECARQVTGRPVLVHFGPPRPGDPSRLIADSSKAQKVLRWSPRHSDLPTIVRTAWNWHNRHPAGYVPTL